MVSVGEFRNATGCCDAQSVAEGLLLEGISFIETARKDGFRGKQGSTEEGGVSKGGCFSWRAGYQIGGSFTDFLSMGVDGSKTREPICRTPSSRGNKCATCGVGWTPPHTKLIEFPPRRRNSGIDGIMHHARSHCREKIMQLSAGGQGEEPRDERMSMAAVKEK